MISFSNVSKFYDYHTVLRSVNFTVEKGEMVFITGPSGAGKSTLLKLIYRAEDADEGEIIVGKFNVTSIKSSDVPNLRRQIGVVFQDFRLLKGLSVYENVAIALRIRGLPEKEIKSRVFDVLKRVNIRHLADSNPKALSGGEQQRVVIARAVVAEPQVILADEPTGNLDPNTAIDIINLLKDINITGSTIIVATHNKELFRGTGKRVLRIDSNTIAGEEIG
ncbi:MAG: cell division ATP-binding protein FtsE [Thermodesulfovibrionales bacterium]|nr:cell division ATP-binding protein FtsE [Thermodesulfovibrionales bacterium]